MHDLKQDLRVYVDRLAAEAEEFAEQRVATPSLSRRRPHWLFSAAAAVLVVVVIAVTAVLLRNGDDATISASNDGPRQVAPDRLLGAESNLEMFMRVEATRSEVATVRRAVVGSSAIRRYAYVSKQAALRTYRRFTRDNPALSDDVTAAVLPASFRIQLRDCSAKSDLQAFFEQVPGVDEVVAGEGLSHELAERYDGADEDGELPRKTLHGTCGGRLPSRAEMRREIDAARDAFVLER